MRPGEIHPFIPSPYPDKLCPACGALSLQTAGVSGAAHGRRVTILLVVLLELPPG